MGAYISSPSHAMLTEVGEMPLKYRRKFIANKEIIKNRINGINVIDEIDDHISNAVGNNISKFFLMANKIEFKNILDKVGINVQFREKPPNLIIKESLRIDNKIINKKTIINRDIIIMRNKLKEMYSDYFKIYTDGSILEHKIGLSFTDEEGMYENSFYVNENVSIMTAELIAIFKAIEFSVTKNNNKNIVILTDSQSGCKVLIGKKSKYPNIYLNEIVDIVNKFKNIQFVIQWVPGHCEIPGNERADRLAKNAPIHGNALLLNSLDVADALRNMSSTLWTEWQAEYEEISREKGIWHFHHMPQVKIKPWFNKTTLNSTEIKTISRVRLNHGRWKSHLFKLKMENSGLCDICDEEEDLDHIVFKCSKYNSIRSQFSDIEEMNSIINIVKLNKCKVYKKLVEFLKNIEMVI